MRFIKNCRVPEEQRIKGELTTKELSDTELDIIKEAQKEVFNEDIIALTAKKELSKRSHLLLHRCWLEAYYDQIQDFGDQMTWRLTPSSRLFCQRNIT